MLEEERRAIECTLALGLFLFAASNHLLALRLGKVETWRVPLATGKTHK